MSAGEDLPSTDRATLPLLTALVDSLPEAVVLRDQHGVVAYANRSYAARFTGPNDGLTAEQISLNAAADRDLLDNGGAETEHADIWQTVAGPIPLHVGRIRFEVDATPYVATVVRETGTIGADSELLKRVLLQSRCILWQASVTERPRSAATSDDAPLFDVARNTSLHWAVRVVAPEVVMSWLPIAADDGQSLHVSLYQSRPMEDRIRSNQVANQALRNGASGYQQEFRVQLDNGETLWLMEKVSIEKVGSSEWRLVGVCTDITERRRIEARLAHHSQHDTLTGLANRQRLVDTIDQLRMSSEARPGLLHLELAQFKRLNDSLGHEFGDRVLTTVAERLRRAASNRGLVARLSAAEFAILLPDTPDDRNLLQFAERILGAMQMPLTVEGRTLTLACAIGAARAEGDASADLLRCATLALENARLHGPDTAILFDPSMNATVTSRFETEEALRRALHADEVRPFYQPIVSLATGETVGFEALARWITADGSVISPAQFIPVAEESGLIVPLGAVMLRAACRDFVRWQQAFPRMPLTLSINVSERQFRQPYFVLQVQEALRETGFPAHALNLELTESILMSELEECLEKLKHLNNLGIRLILDDFGTGYSSLSYLSRLPATALKIDKSFVQSLTVKDQTTALHNEAIIRTIIALARTLNLSVTAEGIETEEQRVRLRDLGADHAQGYLFLRPQSATATEAYLHTLREAQTFRLAA